nr:hypothetical protein GCM10020093_003960 [Planobispora longispora]
MTPKESELLLKGSKIVGVPYDTLSKTRTHAVKDAAPPGAGFRWWCSHPASPSR